MALKSEVLADATIRVVAGVGVSGVSIRRVATEAGVSPAQVQYYFRTRQDLVTAALERIAARMQFRMDAVDRAGPREQTLGRLVWSWLPPEDLGDDRASDCRAWVQFVAAAVGDQALDEVLREWDEGVESALALFLSDGRQPDTRTVVAAAGLLAVIDGLAPRLLARSVDREIADAVITAAVQLALGGRP